MTRINVLQPSQLCDKHLLAEYRELPRIFTAVRKAIQEGRTPGDFNIPGAYVLGEGHCTFFYDKCRWLVRRYTSLSRELTTRHVRVNGAMVESIQNAVLREIGPSPFYGDWSPDANAIKTNVSRIVDTLPGEYDPGKLISEVIQESNMTYTTEQIRAMSTQDLLTLHNALTGKKTKRFATRKKGEEQTIKAAEAAGKLKTNGEPLSAAIARTWRNPTVAKKRAQRTNVIVDGTQYKSVRAAFKDLGLPMEKHIGFRMRLKAEGSAEFDGHKFKVAA